MIYITTLIFTLLLSHIARATPACGDVASPEELYDLTNANAQSAQHTLPIIVYNVTWSREYSNPNGNINQVTCGKGPFPPNRHFKDLPHFPYIGGAWNIVRWPSEYCGSCWNLTNVKNHKSVLITVIDHASTGYNISLEAYIALGGVGKTLQAEAKQVNRMYCGWRKKDV